MQTSTSLMVTCTGLKLPQKTKVRTDGKKVWILPVSCKEIHTSFNQRQLDAKCFHVKRTLNGYERYPRKNMTRNIFLFASKALNYPRFLTLQSRYSLHNGKMQRLKPAFINKTKYVVFFGECAETATGCPNDVDILINLDDCCNPDRDKERAIIRIKGDCEHLQWRLPKRGYYDSITN